MTKQKAKEIKAAYAGEMENLRNQRVGIYYLLNNYEGTNNTLRGTKYPRNIPTTVISSDFPPYKGVDSISWKQCQVSFGTIKNHRYIIANNCGHYVFKDNPSLVINEIIRMYIRNRKTKFIDNQRIGNRAIFMN
jgi:pimeloyl-ACP methyl ester carboxylesterase